MKTRICATVFMAMLALCAAARADDGKEALQKRFEHRYPELRLAKDSGKVGETTKGMVELVDARGSADDGLKTLIENENDDRHKLYALIAAEESVKESIVAERAGKRNFDNAKSGDYLKNADGKWIKKP